MGSVAAFAYLKPLFNFIGNIKDFKFEIANESISEKMKIKQFIPKTIY